MDLNNPGWLLQTLIGAVIGVALGVPISWWFARHNSTELKETAAELRTVTATATELIMRAQEAQSNWPVFSRDADGNPIGVYKYFEIKDSADSEDIITSLGESADPARPAENDAGA